jgi:hypothetical protein
MIITHLPFSIYSKGDCGALVTPLWSILAPGFPYLWEACVRASARLLRTISLIRGTLDVPFVARSLTL